MRWFKHLTASNRDEKLVRLRAEFGPEGYGLYWILLELIAEHVDEKGITKIEYPVKFLRSFCGVSAQKLRVFLEFSKKIGIFLVENDGKNISIDCPNILKYRDEYTRKKSKHQDKGRTNSGETPDQRTKAELETETEQEKSISSNNFNNKKPRTTNEQDGLDKESGLATDQPPASKDQDNKKKVITEAEEIFNLYLKVVRLNSHAGLKTPAINNITAWLTDRKERVSPEDLKAAVRNYANSRRGKDPRYNKAPGNFFGRRGESRGYFKDFLPGVYKPDSAPGSRYPPGRKVVGRDYTGPVYTDEDGNPLPEDECRKLWDEHCARQRKLEEEREKAFIGNAKPLQKTSGDRQAVQSTTGR